jgi:hypothetical protein
MRIARHDHTTAFSWLGAPQLLAAQRVAFGLTRPQMEYDERASEEAGLGDVGDQALMRGSDTA